MYSPADYSGMDNPEPPTDSEKVPESANAGAPSPTNTYINKGAG